MIDRMQDFINFNIEKILPPAIVTGIVNNILHAIYAFGKQLSFAFSSSMGFLSSLGETYQDFQLET